MNLRNYGLPEGQPIQGAIPEWKTADGINCPNCHALLCEVKVKVKQRLLKGGEGLSTYLGCPACPFASPAIVIAIREEEKGNSK